MQGSLPVVSIVVPFFDVTSYIFRILEGIPKKELQWRLYYNRYCSDLDCLGLEPVHPEPAEPPQPEGCTLGLGQDHPKT